MMHPEFEAVIGLEVHAQLATDTKIFCCSKARLAETETVAEEKVNQNTCPVCAGHPGTLPVLNKRAVEYAIRAGLGTHCRVNQKSVFARKNYFYPDLPKGYQISQFDLPICEDGYVDIDSDGQSKRVRVQRIHMEEDAGKNLHMSGFSLVNLNRACVPLIEIVSHPDIRTPAEAVSYLKNLHAIVTYLGICDGNMQEGNFRCDANVSVMPRGSKQFGTRAEIKNVNSFRFVEKAIEYEIARQIEVVKAGGRVVQETRGFDSAKGTTFSLRSKEEAHDYRYFPDPDLLPLVVETAWIDRVRAELPELPSQKRDRYMKDYGLSSYDAGVLTGSRTLAVFFEDTMALLEKRKEDSKKLSKPVTNILTSEIAKLLNENNLEIHQTRFKPEHVADLVKLTTGQVISSAGAKKVIAALWENGGSVDQIVDHEGLKQVSDTGALEPVIADIIAKNPGQVAEFKAGKEKLIGFFVGQAMKATQGKGNPALLQELILKKLKG